MYTRSRVMEPDREKTGHKTPGWELRVSGECHDMRLGQCVGVEVSCLLWPYQWTLNYLRAEELCRGLK